MEAIKSLPGQLSSIVNQAEQGISSLTSNMSQIEQQGLNILSNISSLPSSTQKAVCDAAGVSQTTLNNILNNSTDVSNAEISDTLTKLGNISTISQSVIDAETSGENDLNALMPTFKETISPNISSTNFPGVTNKFYDLANKMDTDLGSLSNKLGGDFSSADNIPSTVASAYNIPEPPAPTTDDILNRDANSYAGVLNNMPTETFKKNTGFIYDFINLKTRIKAMENFTSTIKEVVAPFVGGAVSSFSQGGVTPEPPTPSGTVAWGDIIGDITDQTDLQAALDAKTDVDAIIDGGEV